MNKAFKLNEIKNVNIPSQNIQADELSVFIPLIEKLISLCERNGFSGLALPSIGYFKKAFVFLKKDGSYQIVINPSYEKVGKDISILEDNSNLKELVHRSKEIKAIFYTYKNGELIKQEKNLKDEEALNFQKEFEKCK